MEYRNLGRSGLSVSLVGIGTNNFGGRIDDARAQEVVDRAIDLGINLFDTADIYGNRGGSELALGKALGARRNNVIVATKFGNAMGEGPYTSGGSRRYIIRAVEDSLRRLGTDYIDLYQMHNPDPKTPMEETLEALDTLVRSGKVRYIGSSNFAGWQIAKAYYLAKKAYLTPFISAQNDFSLLNRGIEKEVLPACHEFGVGMLPYFPLASGLLTGKYRKGEPPPEGTRLAGPMGRNFLSERNLDRAMALQAWAEERGHTLLELAMSWLACKPAIGSVIAGATSAVQVEANAAAATWKLTPAQMAEADALAK